MVSNCENYRHSVCVSMDGRTEEAARAGGDGRAADFTENGESGGVMEGSGEERAGDGESIGAACCAIVDANV